MSTPVKAKMQFLFYFSKCITSKARETHSIFLVSGMEHIIDAEISYQVFAGAVLGFAVATFTGMMSGLGNSG